MSLSDTKLKNVKGREKQFKLMDDLGLYALIKPNGSVLWRFDFQLAGKRKTLALGKYPAVSIKMARDGRDKARDHLALGEDPTIHRKLEKITAAVSRKNTFGAVVDDYLDRLRIGKRAAKTIELKTWLLKTVCKELRDRPISAIKPIEVLVIMQRYEAREKHATARLIKSAVSEVFRLAVVTLRAEMDVTLSLNGALNMSVTTSRASITDEKKFGMLMAKIDEYSGWPGVTLALRFLATTGVRPVECRLTEWSELNLAARKWTIPPERMKMRREHVVPLSDQAIAIIEEAKRLAHNKRYVFSSPQGDNEALSPNAMNMALRRIGYDKTQHVPHGFRSSLSTIMNERGYDFELIECALAHKDTSVRGVYNRAKYWTGRVSLMQDWADLIDELKSDAQKQDRFDNLF